MLALAQAASGFSLVRDAWDLLTRSGFAKPIYAVVPAIKHSQPASSFYVLVRLFSAVAGCYVAAMKEIFPTQRQ